MGTRTPTSLKDELGAPIFLADKPCTGCGCYLTFAFECSCGQVHSDVCYNCGGFVDMEHEPIEQQNEGLDMHWAGRCTAGKVEHTHTHPFKDFDNKRSARR